MTRAHPLLVDSDVVVIPVVHFQVWCRGLVGVSLVGLAGTCVVWVCTKMWLSRGIEAKVEFA